MNDTDPKAHEQDILVIAKGAGIVFGGTLIGAGLRYLFQIIAARNLGAELFGLFILGFAIFKIASMIAELGLPNGIVRYIAIYFGEKDTARVKGIIISARYLALVSSLGVSLVLILSSSLFAQHIFHNPDTATIIRIFALAIPFTTLTTIFLFSTQAFKVMKYKVLVREIFEPLMRIILIFFFSFLSWKLGGILAAYTIPTIIGVYLAYHYLKKVFPVIRDRSVGAVLETRKLLHFSLPLLFVQFFGLVILWVDTLMLGYFKSALDVGIYGAAQRTALLGSLISASFGSIFAPIISDLFNRNELGKLRHYFQTIAKWIFTIGFPILLLTMMLSKQILGFFGQDFSRGGASLIILCAAWIIHSAVGSVGQMIIMTGKEKLHLYNMIAVLMVNILLNILFIPPYGIVGAALATAVSIALFNFIELYQVYRFFKIQPYRLDFLKPIFSGILATGIFFLLTELIFNRYNPISIVILCFIFFFSYVTLIILFGFQSDDKIILNKIKVTILAILNARKKE